MRWRSGGTTRIATGSTDPQMRGYSSAAAAGTARLDHDEGLYDDRPDGARIATGSDGSARVFDAATGAQIARLDQDGRVNAAAFGPDGTRIATGSTDRSVRGGGSTTASWPRKQLRD